MSRLIAGSHGGRRLATPPGDRTRPTSDRVREALFSALTAWAGRAGGPAGSALSGLSFADLYAGSGAVGLEAASRGADPVLLVEGDARTGQVTRRNAGGLGLPVEVRVAKVETLVRLPPPQRYDVVFADPPYALAGPALDEVVAALAGGGWLAADALVVLERSRRTPDPRWPDGFADTWHKRYGDTVLHFGQAGSVPPGPADVPAGEQEGVP
jgi:16S rRNA (guanine966-N2)-methyltransferase